MGGGLIWARTETQQRATLQPPTIALASFTRLVLPVVSLLKLFFSFSSSSFLNNNRVSALETGCFVNLSSSLQVLRLNRNRLSTIPAKIFQLPNLQHL